MTQKQFFAISLVIFLVLVLMCCRTGGKTLSQVKLDYKDYYYPIESFSTPKVYHFAIDNEKTGDLFWVLTTVTEDNKTYLLTDSYMIDSLDNLSHIEFIKEEINNKGASVKEYIETQRNENGQTFKSSAIMESESVFHWNLKEDEDITWKFKNESKVYPGFEVTTLRNRKFTGENTIIDFDGKRIPAIEFTDNFRVSYIGILNIQQDDFAFTQTSFYAKGVGLYKFIRVFPDSKAIYTLKEILPLAEWKKKQ